MGDWFIHANLAHSFLIMALLAGRYLINACCPVRTSASRH